MNKDSGPVPKLSKHNGFWHDKTGNMQTISLFFWNHYSFGIVGFRVELFSIPVETR